MGENDDQELASACKAMSLGVLHLLASIIIAANSSVSRDFDRPAVDHARAQACLMPHLLAERHQ